ncbi:putative RNA methyltransferase, partial [Tsukamurella sp. 8J]
LVVGTGPVEVSSVAEVPPGLRTAAPALACPHCGAALEPDEATLICAAGHSFDVARQGYVTLLGGGGAAVVADDAAMIDARGRFLETGHYSAFLSAVADGAAAAEDAAAGAGSPLILDCGAGEGSYLSAAVERTGARVGIGLDLSKPAARRLARRGPRSCGVVANGWDRLPVGDGVVSAVLSVFAPRNAAEFARVLAPGGVVVALTPGPRHLHELVGPLGMISVEEGKVARLDSVLGRHLELVGRESLDWVMDLGPDAACDLVAMGPSAHHTEPEARRRAVEALLGADDTVPVSASGLVSVYRKA